MRTKAFRAWVLAGLAFGPASRAEDAATRLAAVQAATTVTRANSTLPYQFNATTDRNGQPILYGVLTQFDGTGGLSANAADYERHLDGRITRVNGNPRDPALPRMPTAAAFTNPLTSDMTTSAGRYLSFSYDTGTDTLSINPVTGAGSAPSDIATLAANDFLPMDYSLSGQDAALMLGIAQNMRGMFVRNGTQCDSYGIIYKSAPDEFTLTVAPVDPCVDVAAPGTFITTLSNITYTGGQPLTGTLDEDVASDVSPSIQARQIKFVDATGKGALLTAGDIQTFDYSTGSQQVDLSRFTAADPYVFSDNFESGDHSQWSASAGTMVFLPDGDLTAAEVGKQRAINATVSDRLNVSTPGNTTNPTHRFIAYGEDGSSGVVHIDEHDYTGAELLNAESNIKFDVRGIQYANRGGGTKYGVALLTNTRASDIVNPATDGFYSIQLSLDNGGNDPTVNNHTNGTYADVRAADWAGALVNESAYKISDKYRLVRNNFGEIQAVKLTDELASSNTTVYDSELLMSRKIAADQYEGPLRSPTANLGTANLGFAIAYSGNPPVIQDTSTMSLDPNDFTKEIGIIAHKPEGPLQVWFPGSGSTSLVKSAGGNDFSSSIRFNQLYSAWDSTHLEP